MNIYRERAYLVAVLAAIFPSHWTTDDKEPDYPVIIIETPNGQLSWHISKDDRDVFRNIGAHESFTRDWDGHSTGEKYARLGTLIQEIEVALESPGWTL